MSQCSAPTDMLITAQVMHGARPSEQHLWVDASQNMHATRSATPMLLSEYRTRVVLHCSQMISYLLQPNVGALPIRIGERCRHRPAAHAAIIMCG